MDSKVFLDSEGLWEYHVVVNDEIISTFNQLEEVKKHLNDK